MKNINTQKHGVINTHPLIQPEQVFLEQLMQGKTQATHVYFDNERAFPHPLQGGGLEGDNSLHCSPPLPLLTSVVAP